MKKFFAVLTVLILGTTLAVGTGCGGTNNDPNTLHVWGEQVESDYEETLKVNPNDPKALFSKAVLEKFYAMHPEATVEIVDMGWAETLHQQFMNAARGNQLPDVFFGETYTPTYMRNELLKPLEFDQALIDDLYPCTYQLYSMDGEIYGVPIYTGNYALMYNKTILQGAGIAEEDWVPETWDDLLTNARKVAQTYVTSDGKIDVGGMMLNLGYALNAAYYNLPWVRQTGAEYVNAGDEITFDDEKAVAAYEFVRELAKTAPMNSLDLSEDSLNNLFRNNKAAYRVAGPWEYSSIPESDRANFGTCALPLPEGGIESNVSVGNVVASITRDCDNVELATDFIEVFLDPEIQAMLIDSFSRLPVRESVFTEELIADRPEMEPYREAMSAPNNSGGLPALMQNSQRIWDRWYSGYYEILTTDWDIREILQEIQDDTAGLN